MNYRNEREFSLYASHDPIRKPHYIQAPKRYSRLVAWGRLFWHSVGIASIVFLGWLLLRAVFGG